MKDLRVLFWDGLLPFASRPSAGHPLTKALSPSCTLSTVIDVLRAGLTVKLGDFAAPKPCVQLFAPDDAWEEEVYMARAAAVAGQRVDVCFEAGPGGWVVIPVSSKAWIPLCDAAACDTDMTDMLSFINMLYDGAPIPDLPPRKSSSMLKAPIKLPGACYPVPLFPRLGVLLMHWKQMALDCIRAVNELEILRNTRMVLRDGELHVRGDDVASTHAGWIQGFAAGWSILPLVTDAKLHQQNVLICADTGALLKKCVGVRRAAFFAFQPGASIAPFSRKTGVCTGSVAVRIVLSAFETHRVLFSVNGETFDSKPGEVMAYDTRATCAVSNLSSHPAMELYLELGLV